ERVWHGSQLFRPFLSAGALRNIMFTETGAGIPFQIRCFAYQDRFGRETLSLNRTFHFDAPRKFDEYVVQVPGTDTVIIYAGTHQHLAVKLDFAVSSRKGLLIRTGRQRMLLSGISFRFPLILSAVAEVHEWYDDELQCFRIDGRVRNKLFG